MIIEKKIERLEQVRALVVEATTIIQTEFEREFIEDDRKYLKLVNASLQLKIVQLGLEE